MRRGGKRRSVCDSGALLGSGSLHFWLNSTEVEHVEMVFVKVDDHNSKESRWLSKGKLASWTSTSFHLLRSNPFSFYISQISRFFAPVPPFQNFMDTNQSQCDGIRPRKRFYRRSQWSHRLGPGGGNEDKKGGRRESSVSQPEAESAKTNETKVSRNSPCRLLERLVELRRAKRRGEGGIVEREFYFSNSVG